MCQKFSLAVHTLEASVGQQQALGPLSIKLPASCTCGPGKAGLDEVLKSQGGWAQEKFDGFQRSDGEALNLWSKHFVSGSSYSIQLESCMVGGVIGTPLASEGKVTKCSGLEIAWNPPETMTEGTLTNPGDRPLVVIASTFFLLRHSRRGRQNSMHSCLAGVL